MLLPGCTSTCGRGSVEGMVVMWGIEGVGARHGTVRVSTSDECEGAFGKLAPKIPGAPPDRGAPAPGPCSKATNVIEQNMNITVGRIG